MKFNSLSSKIGSGYLVILLLLSLVTTVTIVKIADIQQNSESAFNLDVPINYHSQRVQVHVSRSLAALRGWVALGQVQFHQELSFAWRDIDDATNQLSLLIAKKNDGVLTDDFKQLKQDLEKLNQFQQQIENIAQTADNKPGLKLLSNELSPVANALNKAISELMDLELLGQTSQERAQLVKHMADFRASLANSMAAMRGFLLLDNKAFSEDFDLQWANNEASYLFLEQNKRSFNSEQQLKFIRLQQLRADLTPMLNKLKNLRDSKDWDIAKKWMADNVVPLEQKIISHIDAMVDIKQTSLADNLLTLEHDFTELNSISAVLLLVGLLLSIALALYITRLIMHPIKRVVELAEQVSLGNFNTAVQLSGAEEIEQLSTTLSKMTFVLKKVTTHANRVANGDYSQDFVPQSEQDQLGNALQKMTIHLRLAGEQNAQQNWFKSGVAGLTDCLRGNANLLSICQSSLNYLVNYLDAKVAVVYLHKEKKLKLVASYAYQVRSQNVTEFSFGEGMIGQAALERTAVIFNEVPKDHLVLNINSGLGESVAPSVLVLPLVNNQAKSGDVVGVMAFGNNLAFSQQHLELLNKVAESIAIAIESANSQARVQLLLEESQQQAEELQNRQQELAAANVELEEQATYLKQTEEELRAQGDNLVKTNQVLEDKTKVLEQQKQDIQRKNEVVDQARVELEQRTKDLEVASKYKSEFLANMSHELRTPLNSLLILSQVLGRNVQGNLTEEQISDVEMIHSGGKSLLALINDILDLSKVEAGKLKLTVEKINVANLVESLKRQFTALAHNKGINFVQSMTNAPKYIYSDGQRLEQILRNLLANAIKFTEQGRVELQIEMAPNDFTFKNPDFSSDDIIAISIIDTGIGIPEQQQHAIFEAFQQGDGSTSRQYGGTGLGLTISRELSRLLQAEIHLTSEQGKGSVFTLYLGTGIEAMASLESDTTFTPTQSLVPPDRQFESVYMPDDRSSTTDTDKVLLIVEDDRGFARSVMEFARTRGFKCLVTDKGMEALELVMRYTPNAIILDLSLTDMHGLKVLEALKASPMTRDIPVHIISAQDADEELIKKGAMGFLSKPTELDALDKVLSKFDALTKGNIKQLLLIEDDELSCRSIRRFLEEKKIKITSVNSGQQALEQIQQYQFDCIVLDLNLPDMTGFEWLTQVEQQNIMLPPVIVYTGQELTDEEYKSLLQYANRIVIKATESPERLHDEVALFLHQVKEQKSASQPDSQLQDLVEVFKGKRVLVVDDDLRNSYALSKVLKEYGMEVIIADNGALALEKLDNDQNVDLILMDIMMPIMDGYEAIKNIRGKYENQHPIIALTAKAMPEDREHCINAGANDYLAKPVDINRLVSMVKVWLYH